MAEGHRERLKNRFLNQSLDGFEPHNALELLLFYTIPRKDTNGIAHALIDKFGSFSGVLDANYNDLLTVSGITPHTATLIKMLPDMFRYYQLDSNKSASVFTSLDSIGKYFVNRFVGINREVVFVLMLDSNNRFIACNMVHEGSVTSAGVNIRKLISDSLSKDASAIAIAHNHPGGIPVPSPDDKSFTDDLSRALSLMRIEFIDHFIIAQNKYCACLSRITGSADV